MPTAPVTSAVASVTTLIAVSWARGSISTRAMPTSGMKTASVSAQSSNQCIGVQAPCRRTGVRNTGLGNTASEDMSQNVDQEHGESQQPHREEEEQGVALHATRL